MRATFAIAAHFGALLAGLATGTPDTGNALLRGSAAGNVTAAHSRPKLAVFTEGTMTGTFVNDLTFDLGEDPHNAWDVGVYSDEHLTHSCANYIDDGTTVFSRDGNLVLKVSSVCEGGGCLNSGRIMSKKAFTYGLFSWTVKAPKCNDVWPAIWLLPGDKSGTGVYGGWPCSGEIDVLETVDDHTFATFNLVSGSGNSWWCDGPVACNKCRPTYCTSSTLKNSSSGAYFVEDVNCQAGEENPSWQDHTFVLHWEPGKLTTWIDPTFEKDGAGRIIAVHPKALPEGDTHGFPTWKTYDQETTTAWKAVAPFMDQCFTGVAASDAPFDIPFKLVLNIAVGGYDGASCRWGQGCNTGCAGAVGSELVVSDISVWRSV